MPSRSRRDIRHRDTSAPPAYRHRASPWAQQPSKLLRIVSRHRRGRRPSHRHRPLSLLDAVRDPAPESLARARDRAPLGQGQRWAWNGSMSWPTMSRRGGAAGSPCSTGTGRPSRPVRPTRAGGRGEPRPSALIQDVPDRQQHDAEVFASWMSVAWCNRWYAGRGSPGTRPSRGREGPAEVGVCRVLLRRRRRPSDEYRVDRARGHQGTTTGTDASRNPVVCMRGCARNRGQHAELLLAVVQGMEAPQRIEPVVGVMGQPVRGVHGQRS